MPMVSVEIQVWCGTCGAGLCNQTTEHTGRGGPGVDVEVCEKCVGVARDSGYNEGYEVARKRYQSEE